MKFSIQRTSISIATNCDTKALVKANANSCVGVKPSVKIVYITVVAELYRPAAKYRKICCDSNSYYRGATHGRCSSTIPSSLLVFARALAWATIALALGASSFRKALNRSTIIAGLLLPIDSSSRSGSAKPRRIRRIHRIIADIGIHIHAILVSDGIGLHEPAQGGGVDAGLVVIHAELGYPGLAGILEPADIAGRGDAPFVIAVDVGDGVCVVGDRDDAAALVGMEEPAAGVGGAGALIPRAGPWPRGGRASPRSHRIVDPRTMDIAVLR